ncbi:BTB/POZ domain-containing protein 6-A [Aphelenchoides avenae]|nr:BTB/POZ domain-containing protein 6-A [Aphelenchus avenae]
MELNVETAVGAAFVAKKYMVASTYSAAVTFLTTELSKERVCELLKCLPSLGLLEEVGGTFWDTFDREAEAILLSPEFLDVNYEALREILARDTICARETTIYSQTIEWAKAELRRQSKSSSSEEQETEVADEGVRELLGEAIRLIRFPAMTIKEFSQGPAKSGVLTDEVIERA